MTLRLAVTGLAVAGVLAGGCAEQQSVAQRFTLSEAQASRYETAYIAAVTPDGAADGGEHVVVANRHDVVRADLGGWAVVDGDGNRIPIPPSTQLEPGQRLIVYPGSGDQASPAATATGEPASKVVSGGLGGDILDGAGETVRLLDASDVEVARFDYGGRQSARETE